MKTALVLAIVCAGCIGNLDPEWQLDHDRIVAVRATPPHIRAGEHAMLDALVAHKGGPTDIEQPTGVTALNPTDLYPAVLDDQGTWQVVGPDDATLAAERTKLGIAADAPVPFVIILDFPPSNGQPLVATKVVYLGDSADNPAMPPISVAGQPPGASIVIASDVDVPMTTDVDPSWKVNWLTSCGTMHDDNEHAAFDHVQPKDPKQGELATVIRDTAGGVVWQVWPISAQ